MMKRLQIAAGAALGALFIAASAIGSANAAPLTGAAHVERALANPASETRGVEPVHYRFRRHHHYGHRKYRRHYYGYRSYSDYGRQYKRRHYSHHPRRYLRYSKRRWH